MAFCPIDELLRDISHDLIHVDSPHTRLSDILELADPNAMEQMQVLYQDEGTKTVVLKTPRTITLREGKQGTTPVTAVCKIAYGPDALARLTREYHVYNRLYSLQGQHIPHCYGLFHCPATVDQACLLLEYGGEALSPYDARSHPSFSAVMTKTWSFRKDLLDILQRIHKLGVIHGRFYRREDDSIIPKNILVRVKEDKGSSREVPCIINFDEADLAHRCEVEKDVSARAWGFPLYMTGIYDSLCEELVWSANHAIWLPHTILWQAKLLDVGDVIYMAPKDVISKYMKQELGPKDAKHFEEDLIRERGSLLSELMECFDWSSREAEIEPYKNIKKELEEMDVENGNGFVRRKYD